MTEQPPENPDTGLPDTEVPTPDTGTPDSPNEPEVNPSAPDLGGGGSEDLRP